MTWKNPLCHEWGEQPLNAVPAGDRKFLGFVNSTIILEGGGGRDPDGCSTDHLRIHDHGETGLSRYKENRKFGCSFFLTVRTRGIYPKS